MKYLLKYKGKYRVLAYYNEKTNDFPRDHLGNIDPSFDDYYIPCKGNAQIYHYGKSVLVAYIPSLIRGKNIIKALNEVNPDIVSNFEEYTGECEFKFHSKYIDTVADVMSAKTYGASISPLSPKNLPKQKYIIPEKDLAEYKSLTAGLELNDIRSLYQEFDKKIIKYMKNKTKDKDFNLSADRRLKMLKGKGYIHSIGMWNEFMEFIKMFPKSKQ